MATLTQRKYRQVSRHQFREGEKYYPKWDELQPVMVRRFLEWKMKCDTRWTDEYRVTVRVAFPKAVKQFDFLFEERAHAVLCVQWWTELGYSPVLKVL